jgi:SpoIID/LytB domain protein
VLYAGVPITAYYSSSTGGRTRDAASVWGSAVPYLRSVGDPWSISAAINPSYASWTRTVSAGTVLAAFGLPDLASLKVTERDAGGAVVALEATSSDGTVKTLPGSVLRARFGLPAQWVTSISLPLKASGRRGA